MLSNVSALVTMDLTGVSNTAEEFLQMKEVSATINITGVSTPKSVLSRRRRHVRIACLPAKM